MGGHKIKKGAIEVNYTTEQFFKILELQNKKKRIKKELKINN